MRAAHSFIAVLLGARVVSTVVVDNSYRRSVSGRVRNTGSASIHDVDVCLAGAHGSCTRAAPVLRPGEEAYFEIDLAPFADQPILAPLETRFRSEARRPWTTR
jgi:hypothetical protein